MMKFSVFDLRMLRLRPAGYAQHERV